MRRLRMSLLVVGCLVGAMAGHAATARAATKATIPARTEPDYAATTIDTSLVQPLKVSLEVHRGKNGIVDAYSVTTNVDPIVCDVECHAYMQDEGWLDWTNGGKQAGMPDGGLRMEAVELRLRGLVAKDYSIWYRAKVRGDGWTGWASNGEGAGTMGLSLPLVGLQVRLQRRFEQPPEGSGTVLLDTTHYNEIGRIVNTRKVVGVGGFKPSKKAGDALNAAIKGIRDQGFDVGFVMMDLATHKGIAYNCGTIFYGASTIKAPYLASAIERHPEALTKYERQIRETLLYSYDHTYKEVLAEYGTQPLLDWVKELKLDSDFKSFRPDDPWAGYTARDFAKLWLRICQWSYRSKEGKTFCSWSEYPEMSTIHYALGDLYRTQSKAGWIENEHPYWNSTNDGGLVYAENGTYVLAILSSVPANFYELHDLTRAIDAVHSEIEPG